MEKYIKWIERMGLGFVLAIVITIVFYIISSTNGGKIEGTNFYDQQRPVNISDFAIDDEDKIYIAGNWIFDPYSVQVYGSNNEYLYSLLPKENMGELSDSVYGGMELIINKENQIELFFARSDNVAIFDTDGEFIGVNDDREYFLKNYNDLYHKNYRVAEENYESKLFTIEKTNESGNSEVVFTMPIENILYEVFFGISVGIFVFNVIFVSIIRLVGMYNEKKMKLSEKH